MFYTEGLLLKHSSPDMETHIFHCFTENSWRKPM